MIHKNYSFVFILRCLPNRKHDVFCVLSCGVCVASFLLLVLNSHATDVPDAPSSVSVERYGDTQLLVTVSAPENDNGVEVTSCAIEWDTEPGVRQVQAITTTVDLGPNEIQTISSTADNEQEIKILHTVATESMIFKPLQRLQTQERHFQEPHCYV